jgi:hypothetical protein
MMDIPSIATNQQAPVLENRDISQQSQKEQNNVAQTTVEAPQKIEQQAKTDNREAPQQQSQDSSRTNPQALAELNQAAEREKSEKITAESNSISTEQNQLQNQLDNVSKPGREASFLIEA